MISGKQFYRECNTEGFPIWCQPHYLDAVAGTGWNCSCLIESEELVAVWIYAQTNRLGFRSMNFPTFLKYNGPFFLHSIVVDRYDDIANQLFDSLPFFIKMSMEFQPEIHETIPTLVERIRSKAFSENIRQTYVWSIDDTHDNLLSRMDGNYRRMINKHNGSYVLREASQKQAEDLFSFHSEWVDDLANHDVEKEKFQAVIKSVYENKTGKVFELEYEGVKISSVLIIYDQTQAYYLLSVNNKEYNKFYPAVLMASELAIFLKGQGIQHIDFLGSDIEAVSRVWRKLGAEKKFYLFMNKKLNLPF